MTLAGHMASLVALLPFGAASARATRPTRPDNTRARVMHPATSEHLDDILAGTGRKIMDAYLARLVAPRPIGAKTRQEWDERARRMRRRVQYLLGLDPWPPRTPLHPRVTGVIERDDCVIEKVAFESRPRFFVTGNLYRPASGQGPWPGVLCPHGHWTHGRFEPAVQARCVALARKGYVVLLIDMVGFGERKHVGHHPGTLGFLIGQCAKGLMVWDCIRALDYLVSRPEVAPERIGCTGASGGATQTMWMLPIEPRIKVAFPACMASRYCRIVTSWDHDHCICNHVPGAARELDFPELAAFVAPKPVMFSTATGDWTAWFHEEGFPELQAIWALYGRKDNVAMVRHKAGHNFDKPAREAMYAWFNKHLRGVDDPAAAREPELELEGEADLRVNLKDKGRTIAEVIAEMARERIARPSPPESAAAAERWQAAFRKTVRELLGDPAEVPALNVVRLGRLDRAGCVVEKLTYDSEPALTIPALLCVPAGAREPLPAVVLVHPRGKSAALADADMDLVGRLLGRGLAVMLIDVRGVGELACRIDGGLTHIITGRCSVGMRATDINRAVDVLRRDPRFAEDRIGVIGLRLGAEAGGSSDVRGDPRMAVAALFAAAIDADIAFVAVDLGPGLYAEYLDKKDPHLPVIPRLLLHGDLPHVAALAAPRPLLLAGLSGPDAYEFTQALYKTLGVSEHLRLHVGPIRPDELAGWIAAVLP